MTMLYRIHVIMRYIIKGPAVFLVFLPDIRLGGENSIHE